METGGHCHRGQHNVQGGRRGDLFYQLPHFNDLDGTGSRMRLDPPPFSPGIRVVMVSDIRHQDAPAGLMDDQPDIAVNARGPEIGVSALFNPVQLKAVAGRVHLQVEHAGFHRLLIQTG